MNFQIKALNATEFKPLFDLTDAELAQRKATRLVVQEHPGTPCRVSLQDARVGETVLLLNYAHLDVRSPFSATHAIFVRQNAEQVQLTVNEVPEVLKTRILSLRCFDAKHMMIAADLVQGASISEALAQAFENPDVTYAHIHFAKPGCFAATAHPVRG